MLFISLPDQTHFTPSSSSPFPHPFSWLLLLLPVRNKFARPKIPLFRKLVLVFLCFLVFLFLIFFLLLLDGFAVPSLCGAAIVRNPYKPVILKRVQVGGFFSSIFVQNALSLVH